jgi:hypothetical protein
VRQAALSHKDGNLAKAVESAILRRAAFLCAVVWDSQNALKGRCFTCELRPYGVNSRS